jgi:SAM-dependent methyltransferase
MTTLKTHATTPRHASPVPVRMLLKYPAKESDAERGRLDALVQRTEREGWRQALERTLGDDEGLMHYITDSARSRFIELLPLSPRSDVLEIGPGLGQFTTLLAPRVRSLEALDVVEGQARFVALRCAQHGLDNVRVTCGGDDCTLPYADASFDVVVLSLVFEWCGNRNAQAPHEQMQTQLLAELARVLRPGGTLYLSTKNRYALRYLLGKRDEHVHGMRFGSALPRWLLHLWLRLARRPRPEGWLQSHRGLRTMLRRAGFGAAQSYWAVPEMRFPTHLIPAERSAIATARRTHRSMRQGETRATDMAMRVLPAALVPHFTPGLVFLARRDGA